MNLKNAWNATGISVFMVLIKNTCEYSHEDDVITNTLTANNSSKYQYKSQIKDPQFESWIEQQNN